MRQHGPFRCADMVGLACSTIQLGTSHFLPATSPAIRRLDSYSFGPHVSKLMAAAMSSLQQRKPRADTGYVHSEIEPSK